MIVIFWNSLYFWWTSSLVFIYLIPHFLLHFYPLSRVLISDLLFQVLNPGFLIVVSRKLLDFHFVFGFGFIKGSWLFGFDLSFTLLKSLLELSFLLTEKLKITILLKVGLVVKSLNFVSNFRVNSSVLVLAGDVIDTSLSILFFNILKALINAHKEERLELKDLITNIFYCQ